MIIEINKAIEKVGGEIFQVGGCVRDQILGKQSKDIDFLVRKLTLKKIADTISKLGKVTECGESFGVIKATIQGEEFDFAIPRIKETKTGNSHTDFAIECDPFASIEDDLGRRDFTCNSLAKDSSGNIIDLFDGINHIKQGILHAVGNADDRFQEDPLRILRGIQFASRFNFLLHRDVLISMFNNRHLLHHVSGERIHEEFKKAWEKGDVKVLRNLINVTGVGYELFGRAFTPHVHNVEHKDKVLINFILFFLEGGDSGALKPTNEMVEHLDAAKRIENIPIFKHKRHVLENLLHVFKVIDKNKFDLIEKSLEMPLSPKELAVSGNELKKMGFEGKRIGEIQRGLLHEIHCGNDEYESVWGKIINEHRNLMKRLSCI